MTARPLAIFGGAPAFHEPLHVGRPNLPDKQAILERIGGALDRGWLTNGGPLLREFEARVAAELGVKHCVAMCNGTAALEIAIRALNLSGEVIVPAFTFVATAHALSWLGLTPVFCDVDPRTHNVDPALIEPLITDRTRAILGVHLWGRGCDVRALQSIANRHSLALLFDAAHAFGCSAGGESIGRFGCCEVFSFHATKFLHCGEGGAVATMDDDLADRLRLMRNFGFTGYDRVADVGTNGKLSELAAAVGLTSLDHLAQIVETNRANFAEYRGRLSGARGLRPIELDPAERHNFQYVIFEVDEAEAGLARDELVAVLFAENILARRYFAPGCHRVAPYSAALQRSLPVTEFLAERTLALPTGLQMDAATIARVTDVIGRAIDAAPAIRRQLERRRAA